MKNICNVLSATELDKVDDEAVTIDVGIVSTPRAGYHGSTLY